MFCCEAKTQTNLVPNGSFEEYTACPSLSDQVYLAKPWYRPTLGSSDYFNSCNLTGLSTPNNFIGTQAPFHGNAYAGFAPYQTGVDYHEYIAVRLVCPLIKDKSYKVNCYLSLGEQCRYAINSVGVYFDQDSIFSNNGLSLNSFTPQVNSNFFITDKLNWTKVAMNYIAQGGEEFIAIGNFKVNILTDTLPINDGTIGRYAYYFIDSVSVYGLGDCPSVDLPNVFTPNNDGVNDVWEFKLGRNVNLKCLVYNRWGLKVYESSNNIVRWDGHTTSGERCADGDYFYIIQTETKNYKGFLQLIR